MLAVSAAPSDICLVRLLFQIAIHLAPESIFRSDEKHDAPPLRPDTH